MNANELADEIKTMLADSESYYGNAEAYLIKAEAKLRQQQDEIEALKVRSWEGDSLISKLSEEIEELKAEKIRAYDNGYEDGRKPNTNKAQKK